MSTMRKPALHSFPRKTKIVCGSIFFELNRFLKCPIFELCGQNAQSTCAVCHHCESVFRQKEKLVGRKPIIQIDPTPLKKLFFSSVSSMQTWVLFNPSRLFSHLKHSAIWILLEAGNTMVICHGRVTTSSICTQAIWGVWLPAILRRGPQGYKLASHLGIEIACQLKWNSFVFFLDPNDVIFWSCFSQIALTTLVQFLPFSFKILPWQLKSAQDAQLEVQLYSANVSSKNVTDALLVPWFLEPCARRNLMTSWWPRFSGSYPPVSKNNGRD